MTEDKNKTVKQTKTKNKKNGPHRDRRNKTLKRTAILSVVVLIAIVIAVNLILHQTLGAKLQFDWTPNKVQTLSDVSKNLLKQNDKDIKVTVLSSRDAFPGPYSQGDLTFVPNLLDEYKDASNGHLEVAYVDPVENPAILDTLDPNKVHNIQRYQVVVSNDDYSKLKVLKSSDFLAIQSQQQQLYLTGYTAEEAISSAIQLVTSDVTPVAYFIEGHGESTPEDGFKMLGLLLEQNRYYVDKLDTRTATSIPDDAELLVLLEPKQDLSEEEVPLLVDFLMKGRNLLVVSSFSTTEFTNLNKVLAEFNLKLTNNRVQETNQDKVVQYYDNAFLAEIPSSPIFDQSAETAGALVADAAQIVTADNAKDWIETSSVLQSSAEGVLELGGDKDKRSQSGSVLSIGMYGKNRGSVDGSNVTEPAEVTVIGSSWIFSDSAMMNFPGNYLLANGSVSTMSNTADQTGDLMIKPSPVVSYYLPARSQNVYQLLSWTFLLFIPVALLITALVVYRRRRKL